MDHRLPVYIEFDGSYLTTSGITFENINGRRSLIVVSNGMPQIDIEINRHEFDGDFSKYDIDGDIIMI